MDAHSSKPRVAIKLAKISVLIAFVLGLLLSSLQVFLDFQKEGQALDDRVGKILSVAQPPASTSVHLLSKDLANEVVSGLLEYDFINQAVITDDIGLVLAETQRPESGPQTFANLTALISDPYKDYSVALYAPSIAEDSPGILKVVVDVNVVFSPFYERAVIVFASGVIRNIVLTLLLVWVFYFIITKPLRTIAEQFSKRKPSDPGMPLELSEATQTQEFASLLDSINQFLTGSRSHIEQLHGKNLELNSAQEVLRVSEERFRQLYQSTDVSIWEEDFSDLFEMLEVLRHEGIEDLESYLRNYPEQLKKMASSVRVLGVNNATLHLFKAHSERDFVKHVLDVFDPEESINVFLQEVMAIWHREQFFRREVNQLTMKGELIKVIISMPVPHTLAEAKRVPVTLLDITELKTAQDQLRKLSLAVQHNPSAVVITDLNGVIEYVNPKVSLISGHQSDDLVGTPLSSLRLSGEQETPEDAIWAKLRSGEEWRCEVSAKRKDGEPYWAREFIAPIKDHGGATTHYVAIYEDVTEEKRVFEEISYRATHDKLTQLHNRDEFERRLDRILTSSRHEGDEHALCFVDLDQFKVVNDTSGHVAGDQLLRQLGDLLHHHIRKQDTLARIGGDEFGILLEYCDREQAIANMSRIREAIESYQFSWQDQSYKISASIGIAIIDEFAGNATELLKQADLACYVAKDHGRNQIHVYDAENRHISEREGEMHLVSEILAALKEGRFCLYGQPIVPLCAGGKVSYEILIRMLDRDGNLVLPGSFLSSAERYGRSSDIDRWVIENTFAWAKRNSEKLESIDHVAINLSGRSIGDLSILNAIEEQLQDSNLPAEFFSFEITETAAIANLKAANEFIQGIKKYGCTVALDDFGSGLSSFAYLKNLSVDYLKIDGIFVKEIAEDQIDEAMVTAINTVGHVMGLKTIAEFVESPEVQSKLEGLGIDYGQGYGIGRPIPIDDIFRQYS